MQKREPQLSLKRATNVAFVEHMDHEIGKVMDAVEKLGIAKDTLITFSSDNGGSITHAATNDPWRGGKQDHWEEVSVFPPVQSGPKDSRCADG